MIMGALTCDAMIGNVQEKQMKKCSATNAEIIFFSYGIGLVYLFFTLIIRGELQVGFVFFSKVRFRNCESKFKHR